MVSLQQLQAAMAKLAEPAGRISHALRLQQLGTARRL
jgi:hypothetical protein